MAYAPKGFEIRIFELISRIRWFIHLRWAAVLIVAAIVAFASRILKVAILERQLYVCVCVMIAGNIIFAYSLKKLFSPHGIENIKSRAHTAVAMANFQIAFDLVLLTALIHFAGGIDNPFNFYYMFHIALASMLLNRFYCFIQAALASVLYSSLIIFEYLKVFDHHAIYSSLPCNYGSLKTAGVLTAFTTSAFIMAYITTSVSERLMLKENLLLETNLKLVELDSKKSEFVMMVAHEIKSPLATVQFMLKSLHEGYGGKVTDEKALETITKIENRAAGLLKLVNDLLDMSKIKTGFGAKEFKKVRLAEILKKAVENNKIRASASSIEIKEAVLGKEEELVIDGDAEYIENSFFNVISNAVKYSNKGGAVEISLERAAGNVIFKCKDRGIGIPANELSSIFDEFHRSSLAKKHTSEGTGVGMAITKRIVEYHGATIGVESEVDAGTIFTITFPLENKMNEKA